MQRAVATLLRFAGIALVVLGLALLSPLSDLLPVNFSLSSLNPFGSSPTHSYYRVVLVEHSYWVEILLIGSGTVMYLMSRRLLKIEGQ
jgi:hypothetical protein